MIRGRELAEAILKKHPSSFVGHLALGRALHYGEANLPLAQHHVEQARLLYESRYGAKPDPTSPWRWHVELLKERLVDKVLQGQVNTESTIVTNARHYNALMQVSGAIADVRKGMEARIPGDLLSLDIRRALHYLGEITGEITNEDQLDYIFSKFCIGK
jgi:hypothetical protein